MNLAFRRFLPAASPHRTSFLHELRASSFPGALLFGPHPQPPCPLVLSTSRLDLAVCCVTYSPTRSKVICSPESRDLHPHALRPQLLSPRISQLLCTTRGQVGRIKDGWQGEKHVPWIVDDPSNHPRYRMSYGLIALENLSDKARAISTEAPSRPPVTRPQTAHNSHILACMASCRIVPAIIRRLWSTGGAV